MMAQYKKEETGKELEKLKTSIKETKSYKHKISFALNNLERWFAQGKINYAVFQERKEKLLKLKREYEIYLHRAEIKTQTLEEGLNLEERNKKTFVLALFLLIALPLFFLVFFHSAGITGANIFISTSPSIESQVDLGIQQQANGSQCGYVNADLTLTANLTNRSTCLIINASDITIDCAGYLINYSTATKTVGYGINNTGGFDNVTIRNCIIEEGNATTNNKYAIYFSSSAVNGTIENNSISTIGSYSYGIYLASSSNSSDLTSNTITTSGIAGYGIYLDLSSNSNLTSNTITTNGTTGYGIYLYQANSNNLTNNDITTNTINAYGMRISYSNLNTLTNNTITTNENSGIGIFLFYSSDSILTNNTITTSGTNGHGIYLQYADSNTLTSNTFITSGPGSYGIYLVHGSGFQPINDPDSNTLLNNYILSNQTYEIYDETEAKDINYLVYNNSYGEIRWTDTTDNGFLRNLTTDGPIALDTNLFIGNNTVALNTSTFTTPNINSSANITLRGIDYASINRIIKLETYDTNSTQIIAQGTNCVGTSCSIISYDNSTSVLLFNTSNFSSFAGHYVAEEVPAERGGGGSASRAAVSSGAQAAATIQAGETKTISFTKALGITDLELTVEEKITDTIKIEDITSSPGIPSRAIAPEEGSVYKYLLITAPQINAVLEKAVIKFKVPQTWINNNLDENKIELRKLNGAVWESLPTKKTGSDSDYFYYEAETTSFSKFAIVGKRIKITRVEIKEVKVEEYITGEIEEANISEEIKEVEVEIPIRLTWWQRLWQWLKNVEKATGKVLVSPVWSRIILVTTPICLFIAICSYKKRKAIANSFRKQMTKLRRILRKRI